MNSKHRKRYLLAVYSFLGALAVILGLVGMGYYREDDPLQSIYLNLATEIAGFVILFFILERLFLIDRGKDLAEQIALIRQEIKSQFSSLYWEDPQDYQFEVSTHLPTADEIYLLGYSLRRILDVLRGDLPRIVCTGTTVKILIVDPRSDGFRMLCKASKSPQKVEALTESSLDYIDQIDRVIKRTCRRPRGRFEARLISWVPSCTMIMILRKNQPGVANVSINSPYFDLPPGRIRNRLSMIIHEKGNEREFAYFRHQFELLWGSDLARDVNTSGTTA